MPATLPPAHLPPQNEPLYRGVQRLITGGLARGEWKPGDPLPSETQLAQRFRVSIGTVRRAIDELVTERILVRQQGRGTYVATHDPNRLLYHFFHVVGRDGRRELPHTETLSFLRGRADEAQAAALNLLPGERTWEAVNLLSLEGGPVVLDRIVISQSRFSGMTEALFTRRSNTVYHLYQTRYGINVVRAAERLRAVAADRTSAKLLGVAAGAPMLEIRRIAMSFHNTPVELRVSLVNTARHDYWSDLGKPVSSDLRAGPDGAAPQSGDPGAPA